MANWYVKELSNLTQVSVQTLHHYDRIGLLKPSVRLPNGYRLYSEKDLSKLQQIIALKFFGFELSQIKTFLSKEVDIVDHFSIQSQVLEKRAKILLDASQALNTVISECRRDKSIPWETIIKLIEVYRMTQELEKTWAGKALNQDELKEYASFEQHLKDNFTKEEQHAFEKGWDDIVSEVNANLEVDPNSQSSIDLGKRCMDWVNKLYGKKYIKLRNAIWEKGFKGGHMGEEHQLSSEAVAWLDKAMDAYYRQKIWLVLNQIGRKSDQEILAAWNNLLDDMYGDEEDKKNDVMRQVMQEDCDQIIKDWLKKHYKF